jgi:acid phosphatase family membrane protein YuiD
MLQFLTGNYLLYVSLSSWLAAQICKTIINFYLVGKWDLERMFGAGGMPSAHSARVCSLTVAAARKFGVSSPYFAIAFILAAIVMYDAMGVRHETGEQAKILNRLLNDWLSDNKDICISWMGANAVCRLFLMRSCRTRPS